MESSDNLIKYYKLIYDFYHDFDSSAFYFRGHSKQSYQLLPSVFRSPYWNAEDYLYHEIMVRCPDKFNISSHLDKLVLMQHYGVFTRLLDITANPLVALYFACVSNLEEPGKVILFRLEPNEVAYSDSDRALILSCLPQMSSAEKQKLYMEAKEQLQNEKVEQRSKFRQKSDRKYFSTVVEKFYHEICTETPSFKREINPIDLLNPIFVQPNKSNDRILKQDGAFIISGLSENAKEAEAKLEDLVGLEIKVTNKKEILNELDALCINEASLFPEVDRVASYLQKSIKNRQNHRTVMMDIDNEEFDNYLKH